MKKFFLVSLLFVIFGITHSNAQSSYDTALGLGIDFGDGQTLVGPSIKHFFSEHHGGVGEVIFGNDITLVTALYEYHDTIPNAAGLQWFGGGGLSLAFADNNSDILLRGAVGLDYKINNVPLAFSFDWRPSIFLGGDNGGDSFEAGRFGLGFRYVIN